MTKSVYAIATLDSKGDELAYVVDCLRASGVEVRTIDVGTLHSPTIAPDVSREEVLDGKMLPANGDRGAAISVMSESLTQFLCKRCAEGKVSGVIGIGGSGGTSLICAALRAIPIGLPKLMVSTVASGDTSKYIDCSDITMMYSVVDVAGLNSVSKTVLRNAAGAIAGMVSSEQSESDSKSALGMTMFGVTTPCVDAVREHFEHSGFDCLVFHATGSGGRAMEKLIQSGFINGVLDITTTEVADEIVGGIFPSGPKRFEVSIEKRIPLVMSLGAVDMVNFGGIETVPERFRDRNLHVHNADVTLMRTNAEENRAIARWIADKLNRSTAPVRLLVPTGGVSLLDAPGQPFYDPDANQALFDELDSRIVQTHERQLVFLPNNINDANFASSLIEHFGELYHG